MEDDRKLCEYSLPEGAVISALFEPDVDITVEVSSRHQVQNFSVSNATPVMALKDQIHGVMKCGMASERLEIRLGDVTLEDMMPLHFYGIKEGSKLDLIKPHIRVMVENNHGDLICWRLDRKDTIAEVKVKLAASLGNVSTEQLHLYTVTDGQNFDELDDDDETVENYKIKDGDKLYLLTNKWSSGNSKIDRSITVMKTKRNVQGIEGGDTCLGIKVKIQDQMGLPVSSLKIFGADHLNESRMLEVKSYFREGKQRSCLSDDQKAFAKEINPVVVITEEELQAVIPEIEAEEARKQQEKQEEERKLEEARKQKEEARKQKEEARRLEEEARKLREEEMKKRNMEMLMRIIRANKQK